MDGSGLLAIALAIVGVGIAIGWMHGLRRIRSERLQHSLQLEQVRQDDVAANELSHSLRRAKMHLEKLESKIPLLETRLKERNRRIANLQAQIVDRESTIDSLRGSLYGARVSISLLEDELEQVQHPSTSATAAADSITISLGSGLEIEPRPKASSPKRQWPRLKKASIPTRWPRSGGWSNPAPRSQDDSPTGRT